MELHEAEARVAAGAAWLDENGPKGWVEKIALVHLNINSTSTCILGQVYKGNSRGTTGYVYAVGYLMGENQAVQLGFNTDGEGLLGLTHDMRLLGAVWRRYIMARRDVLELAA